MNTTCLNYKPAKLLELKTYLPLLDEDQRIAVHLRFWENLSIQEISNFMNISWDLANEIIEDSILELKNHFNQEAPQLLAA